ncbi:MAG: pyrroline-5-carboxylate reductase [Phycisphaerae bacterium]|nr:pyrroline-5-carboxylate reductase [Phycisphaerae bacterium]
MELAVVGVGNMGGAVLSGVLDAGLVAPDQVGVVDLDPKRRDTFARRGCQAFAELRSLSGAKTTILAVKPWLVQEVATALGPTDGLVVSVMAGVKASVLHESFGGGGRVIRTMPNTPCLLRQGVTGVAAGPGATRHDLDAVASMFRELGAVVEVDESLLDAVTAVSGSGPAWFFRFVEALESAAIELGLSPDDAATLVRATAAGAGQMMLGGDSPSVLRERVTTPNGTTAAGLEVFDKVIDSMAKEVLTAARDRGAELGRQ